MSYGLRVWGPSGALEVDISDTLPRLVQEVSYTFPILSWRMVLPVSGITSMTGFVVYSTNPQHALSISAVGQVSVQRHFIAADYTGQDDRVGTLVVYTI